MLLKKASWWNGMLMKQQVHKTACWLDGKLMKLEVDEMVMKWQADEMAIWWKWQFDKMASWVIGIMM